MKPLIFLNVVPLLVLTSVFWSIPELKGVVGLAWDCGAITTGPATVPIVLSLGVGASRASRATRGRLGAESDLDGFGIVTLASLIPVLTVMLFAILCGTDAGPGGAAVPAPASALPASGV